jgi:hypothetical protein
MSDVYVVVRYQRSEGLQDIVAVCSKEEYALDCKRWCDERITDGVYYDILVRPLDKARWLIWEAEKG